MDKSKQKALKKQLKEQYKHQELLKQAEDENPVLRSYALTQLGIDLPSITQQTINSATNEYELTLQLYHKIIEKAQKHSLANRNLYGQNIDKTIEQFSKYLQAVHDTYLFECSLAIGDIDKIFHYNSEFEKMS